MKIFIYILLVVASGLLVYNATFINFNTLFVGQSKTALIGVLASACVILLLSILLLSRAIQKKSKS